MTLPNNILRHLCIFVALIFAGQLTASDNSIGIAKQSLGKDFGILAGDIIEHHYIINVPANFSLSAASLPPNGELNYWLQLVNTQHKQTFLDNTIRQYHLQFTYQVFYAPLSVKSLIIPKLTITFNAADSDRIEQITLPDWPFSMSPLKEVIPRGVNTNQVAQTFMKPDLKPMLIATEKLKRQLLILAIITVLGVIIWAILRGYLFKFSRSPFQVAYRQVNKLKINKKDPPGHFRQALQAVHQAFNNKAKQALFFHQIEDFIRAHPEFSAYQQQIVSFYQLSSDALYAEYNDSQNNFDQLLALCQQLAGAERLALKK